MEHFKHMCVWDTYVCMYREKIELGQGDRSGTSLSALYFVDLIGNYVNVLHNFTWFCKAVPEP